MESHFTAEFNLDSSSTGQDSIQRRHFPLLSYVLDI